MKVGGRESKANQPVKPGQAITVDLKMTVGAVTQVVNVSGAPPVLDTTSATQGTSTGLRQIEELPIVETWVGFRPGSRDDAPMLGPSGIDRLVVATGHHRNGILLTPVTAALISTYILSGRLPETARPFSPLRFAAAEAAPAPRVRVAEAR